MKAFLIDALAGLAMAAAVIVIVLCSTFNCTFLYRGF